MTQFTYVVKVNTDTEEHADQVIAERLGHDEDYGFDYTVDWRGPTANTELPEKGRTR